MFLGITRRPGEDAADYNLRYAGWCFCAGLVMLPLAWLWFKYGPNALDTRVPYLIFIIHICALWLPATAIVACLGFLFGGTFVAPLVPDSPQPAGAPDINELERSIEQAIARAATAPVLATASSPVSPTHQPSLSRSLPFQGEGQDGDGVNPRTTHSAPPNSLETLRHSLRTHGGPLTKHFLYLQFAALWLLALVLPANILDRFPALKPLTAWLLGWNNFAASYVSISHFPQVAALCLTLGWLLAPLNLLYGLILPECIARVRPARVFGGYHELFHHVPPNRQEVTRLIGRWLIILGFPVFLYLCTRVAVFGGPQQPIEDDFYSHASRITFGLYGQVVSNLVGVGVAFWAVVVGHAVGKGDRE